MSSINVDTIRSREGGPPTLSKGVVVSAAATFSSDVSIAGTITYEDVTNVDAVGVITARSGIEFGVAGVGGTIRANGDTTLVGVVTATSFSGDGSALTGMANTANVSTSDLFVVGVSTLTGQANIGSGVTINSTGIEVTSGIITAGTCLKAGGGSFGPGIGATILGSGDSVFAGIVTATTFVPTVGQLSNRNLIINGAMQVAQRSTSSTSADGYHTVDRIYFYNGGVDENCTQAQQDLTSSDTGPWGTGFRNSYRITNGDQSGGVGASDEVIFRYWFEAQDIAKSGWDYTSSSSYITLSYWVKSSVAQNFYVNLKTEDGTAQNYVTETGSLTADTWTKITKTIPGDSNLQFDNNANKGLFVQWNIFKGTNDTGTRPLNAWAAYSSSSRVPDMTSTWYTTNDATFEVTGVQLEVGPVATPFEHHSYAEDLVKGQRYYYKTLANGNEFFPGMGMADVDGNTIVLNTPFSVVMRDRPTAVEQTGSASDYKVRRSTTQTCSAVPAFVHATLNQAVTNFTKASHGWADGSAVRCMSGATNAYLAWSAEL